MEREGLVNREKEAFLIHEKEYPQKLLKLWGDVVKTIVIYQSKTGFTANYAKWIADELNADLRTLKDLDKQTLRDYDCIIFGGGLYAVGVNGLNSIKQDLIALKDKKLAVFATGASPVRQETIEEIRNRNLTEEEQQHIRFFYLRGGFDYRKLSLIDKLLMKLLKFKITRKKPEERTPDERGMLNAYQHPVDFTREKYISELVSYIRQE